MTEDAKTKAWEYFDLIIKSNKEVTKINDECITLGLKGWELVSTYTDAWNGHTIQVHYLFKRLREDKK